MKKICEITGDMLPTLEDIANKPAEKCPVAWAAEIARTAHNCVCGHGTFCRDGMFQLYLIPEDISNGRGTTEDLDMLADICDLIIRGNECDLSVKTATLVQALLTTYADEWRSHITRKRCAALVCPACFNLYIDPALCDGCGKCLAAAPEKVIAGGEGMIHVIKKDDPSIKNAEFYAICPKGAIKKCGPIKPPCPVDPVPVGSFGNGRRGRRGGAKPAPAPAAPAASKPVSFAPAATAEVKPEAAAPAAPVTPAAPAPAMTPNPSNGVIGYRRRRRGD